MDKFSACRYVKALVVLSISVATLSGCVERRYTIRTAPPGAAVIVNGEEIGPSPASRSFNFYGDRKITLVLDGYQTKALIQPIKAPWWDSFLTEFFSENLIPVSLRDERDYEYVLEPARMAPQRELRERGETLRTDAHSLPEPRRGGILGWLGF
jgi:hypothetical protein